MYIAMGKQNGGSQSKSEAIKNYKQIRLKEKKQSQNNTIFEKSIFAVLVLYTISLSLSITTINECENRKQQIKTANRDGTQI